MKNIGEKWNALSEDDKIKYGRKELDFKEEKTKIKNNYLMDLNFFNFFFFYKFLNFIYF